jgi:NAD(P)-dependent dehydrogenase (short-subunit alcohol dehydrogenase family)
MVGDEVTVTSATNPEHRAPPGRRNTYDSLVEESWMSRIEGSVALVSGANRGVGLALVEELLERGAARVYAGVRDPDEPAPPGAQRVQLDITDGAAVAAAAAACGDVTLLVNNAGYFANSRLVLTDDDTAARREMDVNYFGTLAMTRAFAPVLARNGGGTIVNVLSVAAVVPAAFMGGYSTSKAASHYLTAITRAELEPQGTQVTALILGSVDTRMAAHVEGNKASPRDIARVGLDGVEAGKATVATDTMAIDAMAAHAADPEGFERALGKLLRVTTLRAPG